MSTYFFKTNINGIECVDRVKPQFDKLEQDKSIERCHVDLNNPEYLLEVETNKLSLEQVTHIIRDTGFDADLPSTHKQNKVSACSFGSGMVGTRIYTSAVTF